MIYHGRDKMKVNVKVYKTVMGNFAYSMNDKKIYGFFENFIDPECAEAIVKREYNFMSYCDGDIVDRFPLGLEKHYVTTIEVEV